jgi:hypothetical protein
VEWSPENLDRLAGALRDLDAELTISPHESLPVPVIDARLLGNMEIGTWTTRAGGLDTLRGIPRDAARNLAGYRELAPRARPKHVAGHEIRVARLEDIVRSKQIANRPKDRAALPELERLVTEHATRSSFPIPPSAPTRTGPEPPEAPPATPRPRSRDRGPER